MAKKDLTNKQTAVEVELPKKGGPFVIVSKKYLSELRAALGAIVEGEKALRLGKTRSFKDFVLEEFPKYGKNL